VFRGTTLASQVADLVRCRRLARRGGVKRISANIYDEIRGVIKSRLTEVGCLRITMFWRPKLKEFRFYNRSQW
jgi:hypothetical protein